ncbi:hypothetical protein FO519_010344, partial [Halicephalobus sp. NKZ332]
MSDHSKSSASSSGKDHSFEFLAIPYDEFDVLVSDINEAELKAIGEAYEIEHLSPGTFSTPAFPVDGRIYGRNIRYMIPLVVQRAEKPNSKAVIVWFFVDTGSPFTSLTEKSLAVFFGTGNIVAGDEHKVYPMAIQDQNSRIECKCSKGNFKFVNILGADAMRDLKLWIHGDWDKK